MRICACAYSTCISMCTHILGHLATDALSDAETHIFPGRITNQLQTGQIMYWQMTKSSHLLWVSSHHAGRRRRPNPEHLGFERAKLMVPEIIAEIMPVSCMNCNTGVRWQPSKQLTYAASKKDESNISKDSKWRISGIKFCLQVCQDLDPTLQYHAFYDNFRL